MLGALSAVNWKLILSTAPTIVSSARFVYETIMNRKKGHAAPSEGGGAGKAPELSTAVDGLRARVDDLEADQASQAELITQMATQEEALSRGLQAVSTRLTLLLWVSAAALAVALVALVLAILS